MNTACRDPLSLLPITTGSALDVGCNGGDTMRELIHNGIKRVAGVDINPQAVEAARANLSGFANAQVEHASADALPFSDGEFDAVTCFEVLEHVPAELRPAAIEEIARVLRPGGLFLMSVPHRGLFGWLDPENMRFRLPALYGLVNQAVRGQGKESGYEGQKHGVVFHHHFTFEEIQRLIGSLLPIRQIIGRGLIMVPMGCWLRWPFYRRNNRQHFFCRFVEQAIRREYEWSVPTRVAYNVLVLAEKAAER